MNEKIFLQLHWLGTYTKNNVAVNFIFSGITNNYYFKRLMKVVALTYKLAEKTPYVTGRMSKMKNIPEDSEKGQIEKVKTALLGMQRYN